MHRLFTIGTSIAEKSSLSIFTHLIDLIARYGWSVCRITLMKESWMCLYLNERKPSYLFPIWFEQQLLLFYPKPWSLIITYVHEYISFFPKSSPNTDVNYILCLWPSFHNLHVSYCFYAISKYGSALAFGSFCSILY